MTRLPFTYELRDDAGYTIFDLECWIEASVKEVCMLPIVDVSAVYVTRSKWDRATLTMVRAPEANLLNEPDAWARNFGNDIACQASEDADIKAALFAEHGHWEGVGPGERFVWRTRAYEAAG